MEIHVLQGERPMASENKSVGRFILDGILPAPRGVPQIEVTFDIDANGILNRLGQGQGDGPRTEDHDPASRGLSKEEIERMVRDAEARTPKRTGAAARRSRRATKPTRSPIKRRRCSARIANACRPT
ncbi:MAG: hypothetical protein KatS3mg060_2190 [Dehalococcoidia bacterium]|nr:MAG: hypothetical protein KatS3mg060_2190 [Dehalococcoidia bacterium]